MGKIFFLILLSQDFFKKYVLVEYIAEYTVFGSNNLIVADGSFSYTLHTGQF